MIKEEEEKEEGYLHRVRRRGGVKYKKADEDNRAE